MKRRANGTKTAFDIGDEVVPGHGSNYHDGRILNHVYFAALLEPAVWGAELAVALGGGDGREHIYVVEPLCPFEDDPNVTNKKFPATSPGPIGAAIGCVSSARSRRGRVTRPRWSRACSTASLDSEPKGSTSSRTEDPTRAGQTWLPRSHRRPGASDSRCAGSCRQPIGRDEPRRPWRAPGCEDPQDRRPRQDTAEVIAASMTALVSDLPVALGEPAVETQGHDPGFALGIMLESDECPCQGSQPCLVRSRLTGTAPPGFDPCVLVSGA